MHENLSIEILADYRRRLGEEAFNTRIGFENGSIPVPGRALRQQNLFGVITPLVLSSGRMLLHMSGLAHVGRRNFLHLATVHNEVAIPKLPQQFDGLRILQLSDLHIDLHPQFIDALLAHLQPLQYDICVLTGDFRNHTYGSCDAAIAGMSRLLPALHRPLYAVLGNHDRLSMVAPLEAQGCRFLLNEHCTFTRDGASLTLVGVDDPCVLGTHNLHQALHDADDNSPRLLFSHSPALFSEVHHHNIAYVFAGHTHGGQICLPGGYIPFPNDPSPRQIHRGAWELHGARGYTSPGTGACGIAARFFCPPEVTIHTLRAT